MKPFSFRVNDERGGGFRITFERTKGRHTKHAVGVVVEDEVGYVGSTSVDSCNSANVPMFISQGVAVTYGIYKGIMRVGTIEFGKNTVMIGVGQGLAGKLWTLSEHEFNEIISAHVAIGGDE